jgi:hypothetical protein
VVIVEGLISATSWENCEVVIEKGQKMLDIGKFKSRMEERVEKYIILVCIRQLTVVCMVWRGGLIRGSFLRIGDDLGRC